MSAPTPETSLGPVLDFLQLLWAVDHALQKRSKRMEAELGVTGPQRLVIRIVGKQPGIGAKELAGVMHVHPSTLTGILQRLERQRLIRRRADPLDGRRARFELTAAGQAVLAQRQPTVESAVRRVLAGLDERKLATARSVLAELADALEKTEGSADRG